MYNPQLYDKISQDKLAFLDNITNEYIKNKEDALEEFKTVKNNVKS